MPRGAAPRGSLRVPRVRETLAPVEIDFTRPPSPISWLCRFGPDAIRQWLDEVDAVHGPRARDWVLCDWSLWARPEQHFPEGGDWAVWLLKPGRGWGKNRTGSEWVHHVAWTRPGSHGALCARTTADVRDTVVRGVSGILATAKPWNPVTYTPSTRLLEWANGTTAHTYSSDEPDQMRGPNHHWGFADEFATWTRVKAQDGGTAWDHFRFGCRLDFGEFHPQIVVATTPRPTKEMRELMVEPGVVITEGSLRDNVENLSKLYVRNIIQKHGGTRLGRQEIEGELLDDVEGAIIDLGIIDEMRLVVIPEGTSLDRVVVGVDPSGGGNEQGIISAGRSHDCKCGRGGHLPHYFVLGDSSGKYKPEGWGRAVARLYHATDADRVIGERNFGGDMVESTIRNVEPDIAYQDVVASRGKVVRAEPVLALYEQRRVHHVGDRYDQLEDELCRFTDKGYMGSESPNRADAGVWALTKLSGERRRMLRVTGLAAGG